MSWAYEEKGAYEIQNEEKGAHKDQNKGNGPSKILIVLGPTRALIQACV